MAIYRIELDIEGLANDPADALLQWHQLFNRGNLGNNLGFYMNKFNKLSETDVLIEILGDKFLSIFKVSTDEGILWVVDTTLEPKFSFQDKDLKKALTAAVAAKVKGK